MTSRTTELKQCAVNCEFRAILDEVVRDQFLTGIRNEACQRPSSKLTFARAFQIALSLETAERDTQQLRGHDTHPGQVHRVDSHVTNQTERTCYRRHSKNHSPQVCHFKDAKCYNCGKMGHVKRACKGKVAATQTQSTVSDRQKSTKYVEAEEIMLPMFSLVK